MTPRFDDAKRRAQSNGLKATDVTHACIPKNIPDIGGTETFVFLIIVLLFGARRISEVARSLGRGMREFQKAL